MDEYDDREEERFVCQTCGYYGDGICLECRLAGLPCYYCERCIQEHMEEHWREHEQKREEREG